MAPTQQRSVQTRHLLPASTAQLANMPLWQTRPEFLSIEDRIRLSFRRAESVVHHYKLTAADVLHLSDKYWHFQSDPILVLDTSVGTLLTIHYNLCIGTLAMYLEARLDLQSIVEKLVTFEWNGQYCLTELGHGLDVINMETQATQLPDGSFELHTPCDAAAKFMPPTAPSGRPCVAIIHARLFVNSEDRGPKVFLAKIHNRETMEPGVVVKVLTPRGSARPVKHCLAYFNRVHLPASALLSGLEKSNSPREEFAHNISRVVPGAIATGVLGVSSLRIASYIAASYSLRRHVIDSSTKLARPIISFSTQYTPVLSAIVQSLVLRIFANSCYVMIVHAEEMSAKHFIAAVMKATIQRTAHAALVELGDRCGAQGVAEVNQMSVLHADMRGAAIGEGDILVICIRFAVDLLRDRVSVPSYRNPDDLLSRHEHSLISSLKSSLAKPKDHRDESVNTSVLPWCLPLIEAIGTRMAVDAARDYLPKDVLDLFVAITIRKNAAWYAINAGMDDAAQAQMEVEAAMALLPRINVLMDMLDIKPYVVAPIMSDEQWSCYVNILDEYRGPLVARL